MEKQKAIAEFAVFFGMYKGLAGKDDPRSVACRAEYEQKLKAQLVLVEKLGLSEDSEVKFIKRKMRYYSFPFP